MTAQQTAIVTGAASGLGMATARLLAKRPDLHVVVLDIQDEAGTRLAQELGGSFVHTDITDESQAIEAIESAVSVAPLRYLVNCAGGGWGSRTIGRDGEYTSAHPLGNFAKTMALNVLGTFNMTRIAATAMSRNTPDVNGERGSIVNTASVAAFEGQIGQVAYAAAKAGIVGMTLPLARDLAAAGIRVNTVAPGTFETPPMMAVDATIRQSLGDAVPFPKRLGSPPEFAELVSHLLSNPYINGETIRIDGAIRMGPK
ncbi:MULTISPECIES: SDR family NAD(P)-dependent oxidoreductase [Rhodococcus]|uniref:Putative 3-hydroxyacyl-CoA dehydrogenase n=1 Tax=Rhodococcus wratislaviensis NBRC 100605 TaxID=1219028 RepID=X0Q0I7_RHOWR|nr:SDR family NAD(P)-dependent oxidoreductase [Rhodococcus wratislaviensis]GAF43656.1 putative 3-hydroxyacyl-CoA dehydrogenase [Rhodococcus wratislaviensis NBRC 100605]